MKIGNEWFKIHHIVLVVIICSLSCGSEDDNSDSDVNTDTQPRDTEDVERDGGIDSVVPLQSGLEITIESGVVKGKEVENTRAFLGIPYAIPPVGPLRFTPPKPVAPWTEPHNGTKPGNACAQLGMGSSVVTLREEDCLHVDVWTQKTPPEKLLPVMVWIHGGGFTIGSTNDYQGYVLAKEEVVLVSVNYRLGPLGFLAHPALVDANPASENFALQDQRLALEWVQKNIAAFGGDPDNVTLFGQSAGATSVCMQIVSPQSQGLFHRAILQSGACISLVSHQVDAHARGEELARVLGCDDPKQTLECLQSKTVEDILVAKSGIETLQFKWGPVADTVFLPKYPSTLLEEGLFAKVPVLLGTNKDEGAFFAHVQRLSTASEEQYLEVIEKYITEVDVPAAMETYPLSDFEKPRDAVFELIGDRMFNCPMRRDARKMVQHGVPVFRYLFTQEISVGFLWNLGTVHGAELPYVFGSSVQNDAFKLPEEDIPLSETIISYWRQFAALGDPNNGDAPLWPPFKSDSQVYLELETEMSVASNFHESQCAFWDTIQDE